MKQQKLFLLYAMLFCALLFTGTSCGKARNVNAQTAQEAGKNSSRIKVTFIELGSVNCIPCKMMKPVMEQMEKQYGNQVKIIFHDVWTEAGKPYAAEFQIQAIPTQVFLDEDGREYYRHVGFFPFEEVEKILGQKGVK